MGIKKNKTSFSETLKGNPSAAKKILQQLKTILDHPEFDGTQAQRNFLEYVVKKAVEGKACEIKGYTVATEVFGRREDFNQQIDPIVSIQANKLRRALERYYLVAGTADPVFIEIPKGTYVPSFHEQPSIPLGVKAGRDGNTGDIIESKWPSVMITPLLNLGSDSDKNDLGAGIANSICNKLSPYHDIRVYMPPLNQETGSPVDMGYKFVLEGSIQDFGDDVLINIFLTDSNTGMNTWGDSQWIDKKSLLSGSIDKAFAPEIAVKIAGEHGIIHRTMAREYKDKPFSELNAYDAILLFYKHNQSLDSDSFSRALGALEAAAQNDPDCGLVWTFLGRLYSTAYSLGLPGFENSLQKALTFTQKGVRLDPHSQRARCILAFVHMLNNEIPAALAEVEKALSLYPNSLFMLETIGHLFTLLGEWERGPALIRKAIKFNPFYDTTAHYGLWLNWFRQEQYDKAHQETLNFIRSSFFWEPLLKAATLGQLGKIEESRSVLKELLELQPDFSLQGRQLIRHYVKFDDICNKMIEGLDNIGLTLGD